MEAIRQGDVYLKKIDKMPEGKGKKVRSERERLILSRGEATGHHHSVSTRDAELLDFNGNIILVVKNPTPLKHQEHAPIELQPGIFWVVVQREYSPEEIRRVQD